MSKVYAYHWSEQGVKLVYPGEAEVSQLDVAVLGDEEVVGLEIAVDDPMAVQEIDPTQNLPYNVLKKVEALETISPPAIYLEAH